MKGDKVLVIGAEKDEDLLAQIDGLVTEVGLTPTRIADEPRPVRGSDAMSEYAAIIAALYDARHTVVALPHNAIPTEIAWQLGFSAAAMKTVVVLRGPDQPKLPVELTSSTYPVETLNDLRSVLEVFVDAPVPGPLRSWD